MGTTYKLFAKRLPTLTLTATLIIGLVIGLGLNFQLHTLASQQRNNLGSTLASQLAKIVRDAVIHQDTLSLQVEVDEMLALEGIQRASVYDASNRLLVQAQHEQITAHQLSPHTRPIDIENTTAGYVTIELSQQYFFAPYKELLNLFIFFWLVITAFLTLFSSHLAKKVSARLNRLSQQLPGDDSENLDELGILERRLEPLLATRRQLPTDQTTYQSSILGIACKNLPRLESLLNREHFETLMTRLDYLVDDAADLYGATRLSSSHYSIHLEFHSTDEDGDHRLRAIYCATALFQLTHQLLTTQGVTVELAGAISSAPQSPSTSKLLNELNHENRINGLTSLLEKSAVGEILLDNDTGSHPSLAEIDLSPLSENDALYRLNALNDDAQQLVSRQLALLTRNQ